MLTEDTEARLILALGDNIRETKEQKAEIERLRKENAELRDQLNQRQTFWVSARMFYDLATMDLVDNADDLESQMKAHLLEKRFGPALLEALLPHLDFQWSKESAPYDPPYAGRLTVRAKIEILPTKEG